jgi:hypothetical protein
MATLTAKYAKHPTLTAAALDTVTLTGGAQAGVEVLNRSTTGASGDIYFTTDGSTPASGADDSYIVQPGQAVKVTGLPIAVSTVVKLISTAAVPYSITGS